jgi:hypothetical protein
VGLVSGTNLLTITGLILVPFCLSSGIIIGGMNPRTPFHKTFPLANFFSVFGFAYLLFAIGILVYNTYYPPFIPIDTPAEKCAINPKNYNVTHAADCSKFTPGSIAQDCALHPSKFNVTVPQCSRFIPSETLIQSSVKMR